MLPPLREDDTLPLPPGGRRSVAARGSPARYLLLEEIAQGGMGTIFRVRDPELNRLLALKVLRPEHLHDRDMLRRFLEEARIAGQLQHPGIVPIHDIGRFSDNRPFFTMKLVEGRTLASLLAERATPRDNQSHFLGIFELVCQTMAYAHSRAVIHRDLKPANVMVGAFGEVQVMDWGLAKVLTKQASPASEQTETAIDMSLTPLPSSTCQTFAGSIIGTPAYMSPEQARGEVVDERTDVFGLGGILCEILTGKPTFVLPCSMTDWLVHQQRDLKETHVRLASCGADPELIRLATDCLAENAADRPANASEVAARVTAYRESVQQRLNQAQVDRAAAEAYAETARAKARASRWRALVCIVALSLAMVLGGVAYIVQDRQHNARERVISLLHQATNLQHEAESLHGSADAVKKWNQALACLERAREAVQYVWNKENLESQINLQYQAISQELELLQRDHAFIEQLFAIRLKIDDDVSLTDINANYRQVFRDYGLDFDKQSLEEMAAIVRLRPLALTSEVISALDHWASELRRKRSPVEQRVRLYNLGLKLDDDNWRNRLRLRLIEHITAKPTAEFPILTLTSSWLGGPALGLLEEGLLDHQRRERLLEHGRKADLQKLPTASMALLATIYISEYALDEALQTLRTAQRRFPDDVWANYALASLIHSTQPQRLDEAIRFFTAARAIRPELGHALAHVLEQRGDLDEAISIFQELIRLRPTNPHHMSCLGPLYVRANKPDEAIAILERCLQLDPRRTSTRYYLALLYLEHRRFAEAERHLRRVLLDDPGDSKALTKLVGLLRDTQRAAEVENVLQQRLKVDPRDPQALTQLAILREQQGKYDEADRLYRQVLATAPSAEAHTKLGNLLWDRREFLGAERYFRLALVQDPNFGYARAALASLLYQQRRYSESIPHLRWVRLTEPSNLNAHIMLGIALEQTQQFQESSEVFQEGMKRFPNNPRFPYMLGVMLSKLDRIDDSIAMYRRAIKLDPEFAEAFCNLGHQLLAQGDFVEGLDAIKRGHELGSARQNWPYPQSRDWVAQAEGLVLANERLPKYLDGTLTFTKPEEVEFACKVAQRTNRHSACVQLILRSQEAGFDRAYDSYQAAVSALLASLGQSEDSKSLSEAERQHYRRLALTWIHYSLRRCHEAIATGRIDNVRMGKDTLRAMLRDRRLAPVRPPIANLPVEERQAWERFWNEVQRLTE